MPFNVQILFRPRLQPWIIYICYINQYVIFHQQSVPCRVLFIYPDRLIIKEQVSLVNETPLVVVNQTKSRLNKIPNILQPLVKCTIGRWRKKSALSSKLNKHHICVRAHLLRQMI